MQQRLLSLLADGQLHSGNELASAAGVSRSAIWKQVQQLQLIGLEISAQPGQGYRLSRSLELLDEEAILRAVSADRRKTLDSLELLWVTESTSDHLLADSPPAPGQARVCLAEYQSRGRGRRGRQWFAPAGHGICLSLAWAFPSAPDSLSCLGLAAGVAVLRAVRSCGLERAELKWPNDLVVDGQKLAGILVDVRGEAGGPLTAVIGVGLNYLLDSSTESAITGSGGLHPTSIEIGADGVLPGRNRLAGGLIDNLVLVLQHFERAGFDPLVDDWMAADYLRGRRVLVKTDGEEIAGTATGISADGQLLVDVNGKLRHLVTGDVSVRATNGSEAR
ncbi:MAG: biotin--[acetyl-CoA-carboxylase] ligase [Gammaproteobacteria bacterium]|jgi:BirA family biotin operon repressor/biotin-[acetyl-CoA-carboxylase] ligase